MAKNQKKKPGKFKSSVTGLFVSAKFAAENPDTTYKVGAKKPK